MKLLNVRTIFLSVVVLMSAALNITAQYKNGAYRNCVDFNNNKPVYQGEFHFEKADNIKVPELYYLEIKDEAVTPLMIEKIFWGAYVDSIFYLNGKKLGMVNGYIKLGKIKPYLYFKGLPIATLNQQAALKDAVLYKSTPQIVCTAINIKQENKNKTDYIFNYKTGMINLLNPLFMQRLLMEHEELLNNYNNEPEKESIAIMKSYIHVLNNKLTQQQQVE